ncbi:hypothetical protein [Labrenzia sp. DG1229]|uniref:hypothetical protein n=1 Tax=Labrenzia sp. DG1229 TaxID=681847 RepID=UPI00068D43C5|nr:hypothetical protein [Labrenzia sp. DG1229]
MTRKGPTLESVAGIDGLWTICRGNLRATVARLSDGGVCLYSPVERTSDLLGDIEPVRFLFAPNHYHNKAISEHVEAFGNADLVCSDAARPRLENVTGCQFASLSALSDVLPQTVTLVEPEGLKTGEVWMVVRCGNEVVWVVTDAFCGIKEKGEDSAQIGFLKTFPKYGLKDKERFSNWVRNRLGEEVPSVVVPCHGEIVRGPEIRDGIMALLDGL